MRVARENLQPNLSLLTRQQPPAACQTLPFVKPPRKPRCKETLPKPGPFLSLTHLPQDVQGHGAGVV